MAFDIEAVLGDMASAAGDVLSKEGPKVASCLKAAIEEEKDALEAIAKARLGDEIDDADMKSQIADEKEALRAALLACEVKSKMAVQKAANAAIKVFSDAVNVALKAV
jgi:hypothetical protein